MKRILLTAFAPFDQRATNQSYEIAKRIQSPAITLLQLPVTFHGAFEMLNAHLNTHSYDYIIALGEGPNRSLALEHVALNVMHARIPDTDGQQPVNEPIAPASSLALTSELPLPELSQLLDAKGLSYQHSYSAGTYVCNDLFYRMMHATWNTPRGFIHVPFEQDYEQPTLEALQAVIDYLASV